MAIPSMITKKKPGIGVGGPGLSFGTGGLGLNVGGQGIPYFGSTKKPNVATLGTTGAATAPLGSVLPTTPLEWDLYNAYQAIGADYSGRGLFTSGARVADQAYEASQQPFVPPPIPAPTITSAGLGGSTTTSPPTSTFQSPVNQFQNQYLSAPAASGYAAAYLSAAKSEIGKWLKKLSPAIGGGATTGPSKNYTGGLSFTGGGQRFKGLTSLGGGSYQLP